MTPHEQLVNKVSKSVRSLYQLQQPFRIFHGSTNSTRPRHGSRVIDISALSNVLEVNESSRTATVEPNVPMDTLVQATLAHGLIPPVVMEFPGITVGGGFAGSAGESSSFRYGYFDQTVKSVEMVLADGEVVTASASDNPDLFRGAAGSLGSLGITTKLVLNLIAAKKFVKLTYSPHPDVESTIRALRKAILNPKNDFVDAILFSSTHGVLMTGSLTNDLDDSQRPQCFSGPWDPWFYLHAKAKPADCSSVDYIPLTEYLFRYDRGGFWVGAQAFRYFGFVPFNHLTRWFLNDFMHTRMMYRALHSGNMSFGYMIQDLSLPYETVNDFIHYTTQNLKIWPLWLCPLKTTHPPTFHPYTENSHDPQAMLNVGLWGAASRNMEKFVNQNKDLERCLTALGGRKVLYSHTYYSEAEFWKLYDKQWYQALRKRYKATTLPTVYDKVKTDAVLERQSQVQKTSWLQRLRGAWPFAGFIGIWYAIRSKDYMIHRNAPWMHRKST